MEPAAAAKGGWRFPHVALLYVLIAVLTAAQLAGFLLLRHGLADADRLSAERAHRAEQRAVSHVTDLLVKAKHGQHAESSGGEVLTPPPESAPRRRRARRYAAEGERVFTDLGPGYSFSGGEFMPHTKPGRRDGLEEGSGSGGVEETDVGPQWFPSMSRIPVGCPALLSTSIQYHVLDVAETSLMISLQSIPCVPKHQYLHNRLFSIPRHVTLLQDS